MKTKNERADRNLLHPLHLGVVAETTLSETLDKLGVTKQNPEPPSTTARWEQWLDAYWAALNAKAERTFRFGAHAQVRNFG